MNHDKKTFLSYSPTLNTALNYRENKDFCFLFVQQRTLIHWFWLKYLTLNQTQLSGG